MATLYRWASIATSAMLSSFPQQRYLISNERRPHQRCNLHDTRDRLPRAHFSCSPCKFVPPSNSIIILRKHSAASIRRLTVSRRSHRTRYIVNLGATNFRSTDYQAREVCEHKGTSLHYQRQSMRLSRNFSSAWPLPTLSRAARGLTK